MVPHVAEAGKSFQGAGLYYLHDKEAATRERVAFCFTENLPTQDAEKALKCMAWTAMHQAELKANAGIKATGRKLSAPVYAYSLSWHPNENPDKEAMIAAGQESLKALGLEKHQAVFVAHRDEAHPHLHIIVNRVHPLTGKAASIRKDQLTLSRWAEAYEREHGTVYCAERVKNNARRQGGDFIKHRIAQREKAKRREFYGLPSSESARTVGPAFNREARAERAARRPPEPEPQQAMQPSQDLGPG